MTYFLIWSMNQVPSRVIVQQCESAVDTSVAWAVLLFLGVQLLLNTSAWARLWDTWTCLSVANTWDYFTSVIRVWKMCTCNTGDTFIWHSYSQTEMDGFWLVASFTRINMTVDSIITNISNRVIVKVSHSLFHSNGCAAVFDHVGHRHRTAALCPPDVVASSQLHHFEILL